MPRKSRPSISMQPCEGIPSSTATTSTSTAREFKFWRLRFVRRLRSCCHVKQRTGLDGDDLAAPAGQVQSPQDCSQSSTLTGLFPHSLSFEAAIVGVRLAILTAILAFACVDAIRTTEHDSANELKRSQQKRNLKH